MDNITSFGKGVALLAIQVLHC